MLTPQQLLMMAEPLEASPEAFAVYMFLRADAESGRHEVTKRVWEAAKAVVSGETVQSIGVKFGINHLRVGVILDELIKLKWIRVLFSGFKGFSEPYLVTDLYVLMDCDDGTLTWLIDKAPRKCADAQRIETELRQQAASRETQKVVQAVLKVEPLKPKQLDSSDDKIASAMPRSKIQERLVRFYRGTYLAVFGKPATFMEVRRQCVNILDLFKMCDKSVAQSEEYIAFALENWQKAKECYGWVGDPTPSFLCQAWVIGYLRDAKKNGFKRWGKKDDGIADRASKSWEKEKDGWS